MLGSALQFPSPPSSLNADAIADWCDLSHRSDDAGTPSSPRGTFFAALGATGTTRPRILAAIPPEMFQTVVNAWVIKEVRPSPALLALAGLVGTVARLSGGIKIFARWRPNVTLRYVADSPLAQVVLQRPGISGSSSSTAWVQEPAVAPRLDSRLAAMEDSIKQALEEAADLKEEVSRMHRDLKPGFVQNSASGAWHKVLSASVGLPPSTWKTYCGWKFSSAGHALSSFSPTPLVRSCEKCFPDRGIRTVASSNADNGAVSSGSRLS